MGAVLLMTGQAIPFVLFVLIVLGVALVVIGIVVKMFSRPFTRMDERHKGRLTWRK